MKVQDGSRRVRITRPGIFAGLPEDRYHADPVPETSLSYSGAKLLLDCPARFQHERQHPRSTSTFDEGRAAHAKVLGVGEPTIAVPAELLSSDGGIRSNDAKAWVAEHKTAGYTVLKPDVVDRIDAMAEQLRQHPIAAKLLRDGEPERSLFDRDPETSIMLRCRLDWTTRLRSGRPCIVDYKTSTTADPDRFGKTANDFNYVMQDRWYPELADRLTGESHAFLFIVQEKTAPYLVSVCELDAESRAVGAQRNRDARRLYLDCMTSGLWPGYEARVHRVSLPPYVLRDAPIDIDEIPTEGEAA
ncbi:PD-(D/E)XK nuclease-like domain-containing protein [Terrabacter terrigena]|uniref:PD-(D/E)XK nuclease-like domain-containing protein n=1 Tax=Terrabacter terrigena TaxID=574718 RepID=A0ABW3MY01_9MICO